MLANRPFSHWIAKTERYVFVRWLYAQRRILLAPNANISTHSANMAHSVSVGMGATPAALDRMPMPPGSVMVPSAVASVSPFSKRPANPVLNSAF